jgi:hypothetical protein
MVDHWMGGVGLRSVGGRLARLVQVRDDSNVDCSGSRQPATRWPVAVLCNAAAGDGRKDNLINGCVPSHRQQLPAAVRALAAPQETTSAA